MLKKFRVTNYKNFKDEIVFDLSLTKAYEFNPELVKDGVVNSAMIFGKNGSGKSNLGRGIFDIVNHLTDKQKDFTKPFSNLDNDDKIVYFEYVFQFDCQEVIYKYSKSNPQTLVDEEVIIEEETIIKYSHEDNEGFSKLKGTENLRVKLENENFNLSFVKYVNANSVRENDNKNVLFDKFINFVDNMLLFYSLKGNHYQGYKNQDEPESLTDSIVRKGKLQDFEEFLNALDIPCKLEATEESGKYEIYNQYESGKAKFFDVASTGTAALVLYYYWLINSENVSLIFMDEFDAYYHSDLSEIIVRETLKRKDAQVIFTSHNTTLMDNKLFRPDCLYILRKNDILPMSSLTKKELREAHNLQKMYRGNSFGGK